MRARAERDSALVLRSVDYGESDRVVTLLTRGRGKLSALARAARKSRRRFGGALEPFAVLSIDVAAGGSGMARLDAASVVRAFPALLRDLGRMNVAGALLTLARELTPEAEPDEALFDSLVEVLAALDGGALPPRAVLACAQVHLLSHAGFSPQLAACGRCGKPAPEGRSAELDPVRGTLICQSCGGAPHRLGGEVRRALIEASRGDWAAAASAALAPDELEAALRALRVFCDERLERRTRGPD